MEDDDDFEVNQYPDNDDFVPYVTAGNLQQKNGVKVTMWGNVSRVTAKGFCIITVDKHEVLIRLKRPLNEQLEGWYEIYGVSQGKSVLCDEYVPFNEELTSKIDTDGHKSLARLLAALDDPWNLKIIH